MAKDQEYLDHLLHSITWYDCVNGQFDCNRLYEFACNGNYKHKWLIQQERQRIRDEFRTLKMDSYLLEREEEKIALYELEILDNQLIKQMNG